MEPVRIRGEMGDYGRDRPAVDVAAAGFAERAANGFKLLNGAYRDRTCDLLVANQALSQLS